VEGLLAQGHRVRCLVRPESDLSFVAADAVELAYGTIEDNSSLEKACQSVDAIYHLAAVTKSTEFSTFYRVNGQGTRNLLDACSRVNPGLHRFVYMSSVAAAGPATGPIPIDESQPARPIGHYGRSKLAGEEAVIEYAGRVSAVIIRPAAVYGPRERDILTYFRLIDRGLMVLPGSAHRLFSLVYVGDLVSLALHVLEDDRAVGETYFACERGHHDLEHILQCIATLLGRRTLRVAVPMPVLGAIVSLAAVWGRASNRPVLLSRELLGELRYPFWLCDSGKALRELGFECRTSLQAGLAETADWYRQHGWL
jgi:nucleoside-diphosphate-sugar epimerase